MKSFPKKGRPGDRLYREESERLTGPLFGRSCRSVGRRAPATDPPDGKGVRGGSEVKTTETESSHFSLLTSPTCGERPFFKQC